MSIKNLLQVGVLMVAGIWLAGCGAPVDKAAPKPPTSASTNKHDGWWCPEHGVPEGVCARCDANLVAGFKAKNDWCEEHSRPESQCFICHPEKEAEFAARYEAKYGKKPPKVN